MIHTNSLNQFLNNNQIEIDNNDESNIKSLNQEFYQIVEENDADDLSENSDDHFLKYDDSFSEYNKDNIDYEPENQKSEDEDSDDEVEDS